jgi:hypothetical protein
LLKVSATSDVGCKTVANMIKGKTPEEIRKLFNIDSHSVGPDQEGECKFIVAPRFIKVLTTLLFSFSNRNGLRIDEHSLSNPVRFFVFHL